MFLHSISLKARHIKDVNYKDIDLKTVLNVKE